MDIKLPALSSLTRSLRRDPGISLRRANHHWFIALMASIVVTLMVGSVAYYEFVMMQQEDLILTDPVQTARYRTDDVKTVLERYDALRAAYVIGEPDPRLDVRGESDPNTPVAAPSTLRVE